MLSELNVAGLMRFGDSGGLPASTRHAGCVQAPHLSSSCSSACHGLNLSHAQKPQHHQQLTEEERQTRSRAA